MNEEIKKPPVGLMPEYIWIEQRMSSITEAIQRYREAGKPIPEKWKDEFLKHEAEWHRLDRERKIK